MVTVWVWEEFDVCNGLEQRVLHSSSPCDQDCWYTDPVG